MSVGDFLAGSAPPVWRIERRHAEGGPWFPVTTASEEAMARDEALASFSLLGPGDFLRLLSPARKTRGLWVRTPSGVEDARPLWRSVEADDEGPGIEHFTFGERGWFKPREAPYEGAVFTVTETFWQAARARDVDPEGELSEAETEALLATHPGVHHRTHHLVLAQP